MGVLKWVLMVVAAEDVIGVAAADAAAGGGHCPGHRAEAELQIPAGP